MDKPQFIYALRDPRTNQIRYVGKSNNPTVRCKNHMHEGGFHNKAKRQWAEELRKQNLRPSIEILEECTSQNWKNRETYWIKTLRLEGHALLNIAKGGNGCGWGIRTHKHSESTKAKIREANRVQFLDPGKRKRHSQGVKQWYAQLSPEKKARCASSITTAAPFAHKAIKAKWASMSEEEKKEMVARQHAWYKKLTDAEKSEFQRSKMTVETLRKIGDAKRGTKQTEESKRQCSESMKNFWALKSKEERREIALSNWEKRRERLPKTTRSSGKRQ